MKTKFILFIICVSIIANMFYKTFAIDMQETNNICDFYITNSKVSVSKELVLISPDFLNDRAVINGKIAPGTSGSFIVNINVARNTRAEYSLSFTNFSNRFPENLKFYLDDTEIDIYSFSLTNIQESKQKSYVFTWNWDYESKNNEDNLETSNLGNLTFDIVLSTEYGDSLNNDDNSSSSTEKEDKPSDKDNEFSNENTSNNDKVNRPIRVLPRSGDILTNF